MNLPRSLKQAIALRTISLLMRRHHYKKDLRLVELHPCGGTYDCLALAAGRFKKTLVCFNLPGTGLLLEPLDDGPCPPPQDALDDWSGDVWRYPEHYFHCRGVEGFVDSLERRLGLPQGRKLPQPSASTISVAVLAQLADRFALSSAPPTFRSGWEDSSGWSGSSCRSWVGQVPHLLARCDEAENWVEEAAVAGRLWGIGSEHWFEEPDAIVDLGTGDVFRSGQRQGSLWARYQNGAGIRKLAWWLEGIWKS